MAATWYSGTSFTVSVNLLDSQSHVVSLYVLDWESAGRSERVDVINTNTGAVLNSQTASNFSGGLYLTFTVSGNVTFRLTNLASGKNAVLSGLFFGGTTATAGFLAADTTSQGTWQGQYGADGYNIIGGPVSYPSYVQVTPVGNSSWTWGSSSTDVRDLQVPGSSSRLAACWQGVPGVGNTFSVGLNFTDSQTHRVALYFLDWDNAGRSELVQAVNPVTGAVLNSQVVSNFAGGEYLVWNLTGNVQFQITLQQGYNAVLSGIFFGAASPPANAPLVQAAVTQAPVTQAAVTQTAVTQAVPVAQAAPATASSMSVSGGMQQNAVINKAYGQALQAAVLNSTGKPLSGVTVIFTAPSFGPGGTFAGKTTVTAVTAANGIATAPAFTANTLTGNFSVLATITNGPSAIFSLANVATAPAKAVVLTGATQATTVGQGFGTALQILVTDASNHPVSGAWITFRTPTSGASGTFNGSTVVQTNASGIATAPALTANTVAGSYNATAAVSGLTSNVSFALTNQAGAPAHVTTSAGTGQSVARGSNFSTPLAVLVTDAFGNPLSGVTVTFTVQTAAGTGAGGTFVGTKTTVTALTSSQGLAVAPVLKANSNRGVFSVNASVADLLSIAVFTLTNN